jgi:hypothetical protein
MVVVSSTHFVESRISHLSALYMRLEDDIWDAGRLLIGLSKSLIKLLVEEVEVI